MCVQLVLTYRGYELVVFVLYNCLHLSFVWPYFWQVFLTSPSIFFFFYFLACLFLYHFVFVLFCSSHLFLLYNALCAKHIEERKKGKESGISCWAQRWSRLFHFWHCVWLSSSSHWHFWQDTMESGAVLALLLALGSTATATFYGDSITLMPLKRVSNGTFEVWLTFLIVILLFLELIFQAHNTQPSNTKGMQKLVRGVNLEGKNCVFIIC